LGIVHSTAFLENESVRHSTRDAARNQRSPKGDGLKPQGNGSTGVGRGLRGASRLSIVFLLFALVVVLLLYVGTPPPVSQTAVDPNTLSLAQSRFAWIYSEVLIDEALLLLAVAVLLIPLVNRRFDSTLSRKVQLAGAVRATAMLAVVVGFFLFAFWAAIDLMGGYNGPGSVAIFNDLGLNRLGHWDEQGVIGFLSLCIAVLGFVALRARQGIGVAVRDGVSLFAAPILLVFELALWSDVPLDMYWHVTTFASLSLGTYLGTEQFADIISPHLDVVWGGNVYLLSNWFVLIASFLLILISLLYRLNPKRTKVVRRRR